MTDEHVIGTIEVFQDTGGGQNFLLLCFTPKRIIVAKTGRFNSLAWAFLLGLGNLLLFPRARRKARAKAEQLTKLPADSILMSEPANFQLAYEEIAEVEMKKPGRVMGWPMTITTSATKHVFGILYKDEFESQSKLIHTVLGNKLTIL